MKEYAKKWDKQYTGYVSTVNEYSLKHPIMANCKNLLKLENILL